MKCKVIQSSAYSLQREIDEWLSNEEVVEIVSQTQSKGSVSDIVIVIFYLTLQDKRDKKINQVIN